jgi:ABC-type multidrug transport system ATPase subunit
MEDIISLKNISYSYYGKIPALKNIDLSINRGEMFSIIGLNGCGKSTLLHIINALVFPDSGDLLFDGNPVSEKSLRDTSYFVPQFLMNLCLDHCNSIYHLKLQMKEQNRPCHILESGT